MDVGWRATACAFICYDPDSRVYWVTDEYKKGEITPTEHAATIRLKANSAFGPMTGAIDPAAKQASQKDGDSLLDQYRDCGLKLFRADNAVEAGIHKIQILMDEGRLKIYPKCTGLLGELRKYSRDENGKIRKQDDHLLDALRYIIATEKAQTRPRPPGHKPKNKNPRYTWSQ
jgi:hypothetical protein